MLTRVGILLLLAAVIGVGGLALLVDTIERAAVSRSRLWRFARRHRLTITADNGNRVIRYLATTRRWRATGLLAGLVASIGWALSSGGIRVDFLTLFAGWFLGALVAEIRLARTEFGPRRAASLATREPVMYLSRFAWWLVPVTAAVSIGVGASAALAGWRGEPVGPTGWLLAPVAVAVAVVVQRVQVRVVRRPQPVAAPDLVAADDAIRSRSLHVLTGGGVTLVLYCVLGQLGALIPALADGPATVAVGIASLGVLVVPILGWNVATAQWRVVRPTPGTAS